MSIKYQMEYLTISIKKSVKYKEHVWNANAHPYIPQMMPLVFGMYRYRYFNTVNPNLGMHYAYNLDYRQDKLHRLKNEIKKKKKTTGRITSHFNIVVHYVL